MVSLAASTDTTGGSIAHCVAAGRTGDSPESTIAPLLPARFAGEKGAKALAGRDYQERMAAIFRECGRVLKPNGIMTLMFTHKATARLAPAP